MHGLLYLSPYCHCTFNADISSAAGTTIISTTTITTIATSTTTTTTTTTAVLLLYYTYAVVFVQLSCWFARLARKPCQLTMYSTTTWHLVSCRSAALDAPFPCRDLALVLCQEAPCFICSFWTALMRRVYTTAHICMDEGKHPKWAILTAHSRTTVVNLLDPSEDRGPIRGNQDRIDYAIRNNSIFRNLLCAEELSNVPQFVRKPRALTTVAYCRIVCDWCSSGNNPRYQI